MKKLLLLVIILLPLGLSAKDFSWVCADHANDYSWWVFVYEDIKRPKTSFAPYKVWIKWDYATKEAQKKFTTNAKISKHLYEISNDLSEYRILQTIDYNENGEIISECNIPSSRSYITPETIGECIVFTVQEILDKTEGK